jgi:serine phosphatase RsbU (regulator of sigma subunit)
MADNNQLHIDKIRQVFEKQKKELNESLKYASYIQKALLPSELLIHRSFSEYFLIYLPCDIVSGDFYWMYHKRNRLFFAIADCTGHGVPGAFLSILGLSFMTQIVDKNINLSAAEVLNVLREYIMKALHQTGEASEQKDGIDMSLIVLDTDKGLLQFSGAFQSAYIIRNSDQIIEIHGDKMPIGVAAEEEVSFINHEFQLLKEDMIYLFTDGYVDQFGGTEGKKFKFRQFRNLLLSVSELSTPEQKKKLIDVFHD